MTERAALKINTLEPLTISIHDVARITGESPWSVKDKLRRGIYLAKKSGRRTLVIYESVKAHNASLPLASFTPPTRRWKVA